MRISIDTNIYTALMRGDSTVLERLRSAQQIVMSSIVVGELLYGFRHGSRYSENRRQLDNFLYEDFVNFLPVSMVTCDRYAIVAAGLRAKGTPIPQNDIWIAAHALESGTDLISFDQHFNNVDGLAFIFVGPKN